MRNFIMIAVMAFAAFSPVPANAETRGIVTGQVMNEATEKARPAAGVMVQLSILKEGREIGAAQTKTDGKGRYRFRGLQTEAGIRYSAEVKHNGVPFTTMLQSFTSGSRFTFPKLLIYPTTGDSSEIRANEILMLEFGHNNLVKVSHNLSFQNLGTVAYDPRATDGKPIEITLKQGGFDLRFLAGLSNRNAEILPEQHLLKLKIPIKPGAEGEKRIEFGYLYNYESRSVTFDLPLSVARSQTTVLLKEKAYKLKSDQLTPQAARAFGDTLFHIWSGGEQEAGEAVKFTISGLPFTGDLERNLVFLGLSLVGLLALFFSFWKPKQLSAEEEPQRAETHAFELLCDLERKQRSAMISYAEYEEERERLRSILFDLKLRKEDDRAA